MISIHAPPRGATADVVARRKQSQKFQFTPLREGRRHGFPSIRASANFNSRPSARGDAAWCSALGDNGLISIHAPPRGATTGSANLRSASCYFNSRPSARGDSSFGGSGGGGVISIHAPPRGATADVVARRKQSQKFQFTPLREGRRHGFPSIRASANFNSRPSARGDAAWCSALGDNGLISIHAPPRGATIALLRSLTREIISIHAPPRGATAQKGW